MKLSCFRMKLSCFRSGERSEESERFQVGVGETDCTETHRWLRDDRKVIRYLYGICKNWYKETTTKETNSRYDRNKVDRFGLNSRVRYEIMTLLSVDQNFREGKFRLDMWRRSLLTGFVLTEVKEEGLSSTSWGDLKVSRKRESSILSV